MTWHLKGKEGVVSTPLGEMLQGLGFPLRDISDAPEVTNGTIQVSTADTSVSYQAVADGVADDRPTLIAALSYAAANTPARVTFGPGDYGISQGIEVKPPQGARGLVIEGSGSDVSRIRFNGDSPLTATGYFALYITPSVRPALGDYANYLRDVAVNRLGFYDDDPATHQNPSGPEESHGVSINYTRNALISGCRITDIGDEGITMSNVIGGSIIENYTINCPSIGISGGALSIGGGSDGLLVSHNHLYGSGTPGTRGTVSGQVGIDASVVSDPNMSDIKNLSLQNNVINDFAEIGIQLNCADATNSSNISGVNIGNNIITNCSYGIYRRGAQGVGSNTTISDNNVVDIDNAAIGFDVPQANNVDANISFNTIKNVGGGAGTISGVLCNGLRLNLSGNTLQNISGYGVYVFDGDDVTIDSGVFHTIGATGFQNIRQQVPANNTSVTGVNIINAQSDQQVIRGCADVKNCKIQQAVPFWAQISSAKRVVGNSTNGGIRVEGNGCIISSNTIVTAENINGDGIELVDQQDCIVTGNYIEVSYPNRVGIDANNNCDYTIFTDNNTRNSAVTGRAYLTTNSNIIEANNQPAFTDRG